MLGQADEDPADNRGDRAEHRRRACGRAPGSPDLTTRVRNR